MYRQLVVIIIGMNNQTKYGLRNASNILNKIKLKYLKTETEEAQHQPQNKTFMDDDSLELQEQAQNSSQIKQTSPAKTSNKKDRVIEEFSEIKAVEKEVPSFCDRLIIDNLTSTLRTYEKDLDVLTQNRAFLEEQIEFMTEKIRKMKEIENSNKILTEENTKAKAHLQQLIKQYHESQHNLFKSRLAQQESFNFLRSKIRMILKEVGEDYHYIGFVEQWNKHVCQMLSDRNMINLALKDSSSGQIETKEASKVEKIVIPSKEINEFEADEYLTPDEPKPKKKLTAAEKNALLGDLKSFAKNFKLASS